MRLRKLITYTMYELFQQTAFKAFLLMCPLFFVFWLFMPSPPNLKIARTMVYFGVLVYFVLATSDLIFQRLDHGCAELFLCKPFSRRDLILGTAFGTMIIVSWCSSIFISLWWTVQGIRYGDWSPSIIATAISITVAFGSIYSCLVLSSLVVGNPATVTVLWIAYVIFGATLLEVKTFSFLQIGESHSPNVVLNILYYCFPQIIALDKVFVSFFKGQLSTFMPLLHSFVLASLALFSSVRIFESRDL